MTEPVTSVPVAPVEGSPEAIEANITAGLMDEETPETTPVKPIATPVITPDSTPVVTPTITEPPVVKPEPSVTPVKPATSGDPFIDGYNATPPEKRAEYVANYNQAQQVLSMDAEAGLKFVYQQAINEKGERLYTDEDIEADLSSRSKLNKDREWQGMKTTIQAEQTRAMTPPEPTQAEIDEYLTKANADVMKIITPMLAEEDAMTEVYGIPYTSEMKAQVKENIIKLNSINPKTGDPYLYEFLAENNNLRDVIRATSLKQDNSIKTYLSNFKEDFKAETFEKLGLNLKPQGGTGQFAVAQSEDDLM